MIKFLATGIAIAGVLAALLVGGTHAGVLAVTSQPKGDRLDTRVIEEACGDWPYYHHSCRPDPTNTSRTRRNARILSSTHHRHTSLLAFLGR